MGKAKGSRPRSVNAEDVNGLTEFIGVIGPLLAANNLSDVASAIAAKDNLSVHGADVASATTTVLDSATGDVVDVTGTTTITAITLANGKRRIVRFTGILTLTHGASLVLPGSANITTAAGDFAIFQGYGSGVVRCVAYLPLSGIGAVALTGVNAAKIQSLIVAASDETTALTAGVAKVTFRMPYAFTLTAIRASLSTAQPSGAIFTVDVNEAGVSILSTKLTIDNTEKTSVTAVAPPVISDAALADDALITVDIDQVGDSGAAGLKVTLIGTRT